MEDQASNTHYIYVGTKLEGADELSEMHFEECIAKHQLRRDQYGSDDSEEESGGQQEKKAQKKEGSKRRSQSSGW